MNKTYINNQKYYLAILNSKNHAIKIFYTLQKKGIGHFNLVSAPCQLKKGCNYSLKFDNIDHFNILADLLEDKSNVELYQVVRSNGTKHLNKIDIII